MRTILTKAQIAEQTKSYWATRAVLSKRRYNTQHNDIQHNDIQRNDIQHNDIQHNDIQHNDT